MVVIAQLVERLFVAQEAAGSRPVNHPMGVHFMWTFRYKETCKTVVLNLVPLAGQGRQRSAGFCQVCLLTANMGLRINAGCYAPTTGYGYRVPPTNDQ